MKTLRVKAPTGRYPMEGNPKMYIRGSAVEVPDTAYYRRAIRAGDLEPVPTSASPKAEPVAGAAIAPAISGVAEEATTEPSGSRGSRKNAGGDGK